MNNRFGKIFFFITTFVSMITAGSCKSIPKVTPGVEQGIYSRYYRRLYVNQEIVLGLDQSYSFLFTADIDVEPEMTDFAIVFGSLFMTDNDPVLNLRGILSIEDLSSEDQTTKQISVSDLGNWYLGATRFKIPDSFILQKGHQYRVDLFLNAVENIPSELKKADFQVRVRKYPGT